MSAAEAPAETTSGHKAEVFRVEDIKAHPGADRLDIVSFAGFPSAVKRGDFKPGDLAVFIPPDSVVDVRRPEFAFLAERAKADGTSRIKAIRLRGEQSFGLIVRAPEGAREGEDLATAWGVGHYEPPLPGEAGTGKDRWLQGADNEAGPAGFDLPKYDLESFRRYGREVFEPGEPVIVQEKCDGANMKAVFADGRLHVGSRNGWKKEFSDCSHITVGLLVSKGCPEDKAEEVVQRLRKTEGKTNAWWQVLRATPALEHFLRCNPGTVVLGECFGAVNCIRYGFPEVNRFAAFDIWKDGGWMDMRDTLTLLQQWDVPPAPVLNEPRMLGCDCCVDCYEPIPFDFDAIAALADGPTLAPGAKPGTIREGVVVSSVRERRHPKTGRAKVKAVGVTYLEKFR